MTCAACGGTVFDAQGICVACGLPSIANADTQPNEGKAAPVATLTTPEPTPAPLARQSRPLRDADPAATNPGSGVFCGRCGSAVDPQSEFCGICGNPLKEETLLRMRQGRAQANDLRVTFTGVDAADTQPPGGMAHLRTNQMRLIGLLLAGVLIIGLAFGAIILHLR